MTNPSPNMPHWVKRARRIRWAKRASMVVSVVFLAGMMSGGWSRFTGGGSDSDSDSADPAPAVGYLSVTATPPALVRVDDVDRGQTPLVRQPLAPGPHHVVLADPDTGAAITERRIELQPGAHERWRHRQPADDRDLKRRPAVTE